MTWRSRAKISCSPSWASPTISPITTPGAVVRWKLSRNIVLGCIFIYLLHDNYPVISFALQFLAVSRFITYQRVPTQNQIGLGRYSGIQRGHIIFYRSANALIIYKRSDLNFMNAWIFYARIRVLPAICDLRG